MLRLPAQLLALAQVIKPPAFASCSQVRLATSTSSYSAASPIRENRAAFAFVPQLLAHSRIGTLAQSGAGANKDFSSLICVRN